MRGISSKYSLVLALLVIFFVVAESGFARWGDRMRARNERAIARIQGRTPGMSPTVNTRTYTPAPSYRGSYGHQGGNRINMNCIAQRTDMCWAATAQAVILHQAGKNVSQASLAHQYTGGYAKGISSSEMDNVLRDHGVLKSTEYSASFSEIEDEIQGGNPVVVHIYNSGDRDAHIIFIYGVTSNGGYLVCDPDGGRRYTVNQGKLDKWWSYTNDLDFYFTKSTRSTPKPKAVVHQSQSPPQIGTPKALDHGGGQQGSDWQSPFKIDISDIVNNKSNRKKNNKQQSVGGETTEFHEPGLADWRRDSSEHYTENNVSETRCHSWDEGGYDGGPYYCYGLKPNGNTGYSRIYVTIWKPDSPGAALGTCYLYYSVIYK